MVELTVKYGNNDQWTDHCFSQYKFEGSYDMFSKQQKNKPDSQIIMRIVKDGETRDVTVKEFLLSVNLSVEALTSVLVSKGIITPEDLLQELDKIQKEHAERQQ